MNNKSEEKRLLYPGVPTQTAASRILGKKVAANPEVFLLRNYSIFQWTIDVTECFALSISGLWKPITKVTFEEQLDVGLIDKIL